MLNELCVDAPGPVKLCEGGPPSRAEWAVNERRLEVFLHYRISKLYGFVCHLVGLVRHDGSIGPMLKLVET